MDLQHLQLHPLRQQGNVGGKGCSKHRQQRGQREKRRKGRWNAHSKEQKGSGTNRTSQKDKRNFFHWDSQPADASRLPRDQLDLFQIFLDEEVLEMIVEYSELYARPKGNDVTLLDLP
ncbi:hypothetical protein BaRGS_00024135 [Batillaria attramentaria]|uniref:Uncharacterized protein n=1 Tax=Batillaria attramentaria TaxID=370345 RepID=A0ABD0KBV8_9CAEN